MFLPPLITYPKHPKHPHYFYRLVEQRPNVDVEQGRLAVAVAGARGRDRRRGFSPYRGIDHGPSSGNVPCCKSQPRYRCCKSQYMFVMLFPLPNGLCYKEWPIRTVGC